jgi:hypothetical protein
MNNKTIKKKEEKRKRNLSWCGDYLQMPND